MHVLLLCHLRLHIGHRLREIKDLTRNIESEKMDFISCSCPVALTWTFSIMLKRRGKSRHSCLISKLGEKALTFSQLSKILAVGLSYAAFIMLK